MWVLAAEQGWFLEEAGKRDSVGAWPVRSGGAVGVAWLRSPARVSRRSKLALSGHAWGLPIDLGSGRGARSAPGAARSEEDSGGDDGGPEPGAAGRGGASGKVGHTPGPRHLSGDFPTSSGFLAVPVNSRSCWISQSASPLPFGSPFLPIPVSPSHLRHFPPQSQGVLVLPAGADVTVPARRGSILPSL